MPQAHTYDCYSSSSSRPNTPTVFLQAFSVTSSIVVSGWSFWITQATPPMAQGSFLFLTTFPSTNFSGLTEGGKYRSLKGPVRVSRCTLEACPPVMEHQGASVKETFEHEQEKVHSRNRDLFPASGSQGQSLYWPLDYPRFSESTH